MDTKIEYRVRPVTRYIVTRFEGSLDGREAGSSKTLGEYENGDVAFEVGNALCKAEHDRLGLPLGDERITYPQRAGETAGASAPVSVKPPFGYRELPAGVRCRCVKLWSHGDKYYCCK